METNQKNEKAKFLRKWIITNFLVIIIGYPIVLIISILIWEATGHTVDEWGTALEQSLLQIVGGLIIGLGLGFFQWRLLKKVFIANKFWIFSIAISIFIVEIIAGVLCWQLGLNRGEYSFVEDKPFQHAIITACYGLVIGIIQFPLVKNQTEKSACWISGNIFAWGLTILVMSIGLLFENEVFLLVTVILGGITYGAVTGGFLVWRLKLLNKKKRWISPMR